MAVNLCLSPHSVKLDKRHAEAGLPAMLAFYHSTISLPTPCINVLAMAVQRAGAFQGGREQGVGGRVMGEGLQGARGLHRGELGTSGFADGVCQYGSSPSRA